MDYQEQVPQSLTTQSTASSQQQIKILLIGTFLTVLLTMILSVVLSVVLPFRYSDYLLFVPIAAFVFSIGASIALLMPHRVYYLFILMAMALPLQFEDIAINIGVMKLYPADLVFMFTAVVLSWDLFVRGEFPFRKIPFNKFVILFFVVGLVGLFIGLKNGNRYDKVFGDYRRSFFYFLNYFVTLYMIRDFKDLRLMLKMLLLGAILTIPIGIVQLALGKGYVRSPVDAAHVLSWMQCTILSFAIFYAVAHLIHLPKQNTKLWVVIAVFGILLTIAANFRSNWLGLLLGLSGMYCFLPRGLKIKSFLIAITGVIVLILGLFVLWDQKIFENRTLGEEIAKKADFKETNLDLNVIWRYQSYEAAYQKIQESPVLGSGLGTYLTFHIPTSAGTQTLALDHNVHNSFLWLMMTIGIPGILSLFLMHGFYLWTIFKYLKKTTWVYGKIIVMSCGAYYCSAMTATFFQNYLEQAVTVTIFGAICAVTMLTIYYTPSEDIKQDISCM